MMIEESGDYRAVIHTNFGDITARLYPEEVPITVNNFVFLSREGFYDGLPFHRVAKDHWIQSGDPSGEGIGDPGYSFEDEEFTGDYEMGTLAMANKGPDTNGSQFFICDGDVTELVPKNYTIFGMVTEGIEVVHQIAAVPVESQLSGGEISKPTVDVHIESIEIQVGD